MSRRSIPAVFREQAIKLKSRPMVYGKVEGHWRPLTWAQMSDRVNHAAGGLIALGIEKGDRVAILAEGGARWVLADLASVSAGAADVPIYHSSSAEHVEYMLRDSGSRVVFVSTDDQLQKVLEVEARLPDLEAVVYFPLTRDPPKDSRLRVLSLLALEQMGEGREAEVDARVEGLCEEDLLTIIYTSGTTGEHKGVMITHGNMVSNCQATARAVTVRADDVVLSFLPLAHAFERMAGYYMAALFGGATIYYAEGLGRLIQNIGEVRPTLMTGVPRIYEKIYARFRAGREQTDPVRRKLFDFAMAVGTKVSKLRQQGKEPSGLLAMQYALAHDQVFSPLHQRLGGRLRFFVSGGAALAAEVAEFFHAAGILILEGYGLTETSPVVSCNRPGAYRFGSVGRPLDNVRVRLEPDGEVLVCGPSVMKGYWNKPEDDEAVFEGEWLRTGDIGTLDEDGFLRITERKKDLFKTSGGKYIAPQYLERLLRSSAYIEQACVVGDQRPYCVAILVPNLERVRAWAADKKIATTDATALCAHPAIRKRLQREVDAVNGRLERHETLKSFHLRAQPFTQENGLLTPSLKVKRRRVIEQCAGAISALYSAGMGRQRGHRF